MSDFFAEPQRSMVDTYVKLLGLSQDVRIQRLLLTHLHPSEKVISLTGLPSGGEIIKDSPGFAIVICI